MSKIQPRNVTYVDILLEKGQEELLPETFYELAGKGIWLEEQGNHVLIKCYPHDPDSFLRNLRSSRLPVITVNVEQEERKDYAELTQKYFKPIRIGDITIRAPWNKRSAHRQEIVIEPGMAFGTGRHESTRIMIKLMGYPDFKGKKILDIGCGSGILALYACILGAELVTAVDIDEDAVANARKNLLLNEAHNIDLICAALQDIRGDFDIVLANLDINSFSEHAQKVASLVEKKDGFLLISGILRKNQNKLLQLFGDWTLVQSLWQRSWCGFVLTRLA